MAGALAALAITLPASAQGKSGQSHGKAPSSPPPTTTTLPGATTTGPAAAPFAWLDDASLMAPATVWLGVSMVQWHGGGANETVAPVFDTSIGLTRRLQVGASVPRAAGGLGTTFFNAKIGIVDDEARGLKLAIGPTLEVLSHSAMQWAPAGQSRTQWGMPVSVEFDRGAGRIFGSSGYFSPGIWYAGMGIGGSVTERVGVSASFSHAWSTPAAAFPTGAASRRSDLSGGASIDLTPSVAVFGSVGRTVGTRAENGAGTTISVGLSLTAGPVVFKK